MTEVASSIQGKRAYLSGRITGRDRDEVVKEFGQAEAQLKAAGAYCVFNPVTEIEPSCSHELAMRFCVRQLARSKTLKDGDAEPFYDYLVTLPLWFDSKGACLEVEVAQACGIQVIPLHQAIKGSG